MAESPPRKPKAAASPAGEFELIDRLTARLGGPLGPGVIGAGDDCAAIPAPGGFQLLTCDIAVAGRHFLPGRTPFPDVGWRIATANVSDICACGGKPSYALVSLTVPPGFAREKLEALYQGLDEATAAYGFQVLGGNVSGASELMVDLFMTGETPRFISRGGAAPGHLLAVSGGLGGSAAGLEALAEGDASPAAESLIQRHLRPRARGDLVPLLQAVASAAIDISDGLASELHHLAGRSGVQLAVEGGSVPLPQGLKEYAARRKADALGYALKSGEEYELLFTLPREREGDLRGCDVTVIGEARRGEGVLLDGRPLPREGWDHLRAES